MQPRTAHRTAHGRAVPHADGAAGLGAELAAVVSAARRRAVRDRDRQTDTAHLLHALLEHDPEARAAVGGPRLARLLGYLVQRSIGYGLRWQAGVEDSGALPRVPPPARAEDSGARAAAAAGRSVPARDAEGWSPAAAAALADARARARRRGASRVSGTDLLAALAADPASRAVEVLEHAGIPAQELAARIADGADGRSDASGPPSDVPSSS
ncbi:Clp protease N-terminal domain-containing protein [Streptomyces capoamus]|uniref:Clp protease N-terminal domain-containing protein n=1 Tax=Streptomyces capoamus TaxID=68183 RepID=UPI001E51DCD2|nr:Clp protease N-terminal domain-containing protein [Streptomyces capoamus]